MEQTYTAIPAVAVTALAHQIEPGRSRPRAQRYLDLLPSIYRRDVDFADTDTDELPLKQLIFGMCALLGPIEHWLAQSEFQLDPNYAPDHLLMYLADWVALDLDEQSMQGLVNEHRLRKLIPAAFPAFRQRGTQHGLTGLVEALLSDRPGCRVRITPHTSLDFVLGVTSRLGRGVALGRGNAPHEFTVEVATPDGTLDEATRSALEQLLDAEKPAHTAFGLRITKKP